MGFDIFAYGAFLQMLNLILQFALPCPYSSNSTKTFLVLQLMVHNKRIELCDYINGACKKVNVYVTNLD
jgi:hypothetical protein